MKYRIFHPLLDLDYPIHYIIIIIIDYSFSCIILQSLGEMRNTITPASIGAIVKIRKKSARPPLGPKKKETELDPEPKTAASLPER